VRRKERVDGMGRRRMEGTKCASSELLYHTAHGKRKKKTGDFRETTTKRFPQKRRCREATNETGLL
jgi:hypothetical protein